LDLPRHTVELGLTLLCVGFCVLVFYLVFFWSPCGELIWPQGQHKPPQVISTGSCQRIWPTYAVIG